MKWWLSLAALSLGGCDYFPQDFSGTLSRVQTEKVVRVGVQDSDQLLAFLHQLTDRIGASAGAKPQVVYGSEEALFDKLDKGELDVVIGLFDTSSPWRQRLSFTQSLGEHRQGDTTFEIAMVARNGENRWVMLLEDLRRTLLREESGK